MVGLPYHCTLNEREILREEDVEAKGLSNKVKSMA